MSRKPGMGFRTASCSRILKSITVLSEKDDPLTVSLVPGRLAAGLLLGAALAAGVASDVALNKGHLLDVVTGRAGIEEACLPQLRRGLTERGFSPEGIEFGTRPAMATNFGASPTFRSSFTFQDGPEATRVDGIMACAVGKEDVRVDFRTAGRPVRAS